MRFCGLTIENFVWGKIFNKNLFTARFRMFFCWTIIAFVAFVKADSNFYPFGPNATDQELPKGDQANSNQVNISNFPFFNGIKTSLWVNIKGAIPFDNSTIGPIDTTCNTTRAFQMIAPFW